MSKLSKSLKIAAAALLLSVSFSHAAEGDQALIDFVKKSIRKGPNVELENVTIKSVQKPKELGGWEAVIVELDFKIGGEKQTRLELLYRFGDLVSMDIREMKSARPIKDRFSPPVELKHYRSDRLIAGNEGGKAKHKLIVFSDPLCPFCLDIVPEVVDLVNKNPKEMALYFYHFPISTIHPSSPTIIKAAIALELKGQKGVVEKLYHADFDYKVVDETEVLKRFNDYFGSNLTQKDINTPAIIQHLQEDQETASMLMISGTPTVYIDGERDQGQELLDALKKKYKK